MGVKREVSLDRKQTFKTLKTLTQKKHMSYVKRLTNCYEGIKEELGDLLLHILFYAKIGSEKNKFNIGIIARQLTEKLIRRHPHIYNDVKIKNAEEVVSNWENKIKRGQKEHSRRRTN